MVLVQEEEKTTHPVNVHILPPDPLHQSQAVWTVHLNLHGFQQLLLQLFFWRRFCYSDRMYFRKAWHVHFLSDHKVHELDAANGATLRRHEELVADQLLVHGLSVWHVRIDLVPEGSEVGHYPPQV